MRRPLGAAVAVWLAAPTFAAPPAPLPSLIDRLAAPAFADRERAGRELLGYGPTAVPALEVAAASHPDPEARRRAADLLARARRAADTGRLAAAPLIALDFRNTPLATAVARLRADTGIPFALDSLKVADPGRPVSVVARPKPVWEAVALFTAAAGLVEVVHPEVAPTAGDLSDLGRRVIVYAVALPPDPPTRVPVVLADSSDCGLRFADCGLQNRTALGFAAVGGPGAGVLQSAIRNPQSAMPADRSSAVRVTALPPTFPSHRVVRGAGVVHLALEVAPVAALPAGARWDETLGVRVRRAEDAAGRPIPPAHSDDPPPSSGMQAEVVAFGGFAVPQLVPVELGTADGRGLRPNPRIITVPLRTGDRAVKSLSVLAGVIVGEVTLTDQPLLTLTELPKLVGRQSPAVTEVRLTVLAYRTDSSGKVMLRLKSDAPNPWSLPQLGRRPMPGLNGSVLWEGGGSAVAYLGRYRFADAAGRQLPAPHLKAAVPHDDGVRQTLDLDLEFAPRPGYGPPDRVTVMGERPAVIEVPFRLRDVPLP